MIACGFPRSRRRRGPYAPSRVPCRAHAARWPETMCGSTSSQRWDLGSNDPGGASPVSGVGAANSTRWRVRSPRLRRRRGTIRALACPELRPRCTAAGENVRFYFITALGSRFERSRRCQLRFRRGRRKQHAVARAVPATPSKTGTIRALACPGLRPRCAAAGDNVGIYFITARDLGSNDPVGASSVSGEGAANSTRWRVLSPRLRRRRGDHTRPRVSRAAPSLRGGRRQCAALLHHSAGIMIMK